MGAHIGFFRGHAEGKRIFDRGNAKVNSGSRPHYWQLVAAGEPFRLLFPVGAALGVLGVLMWPLYAWKITSLYPGQFHARIMIEGFLTSFIMGFLGTAFPRLLDVPHLTRQEALGFACAVMGVVWLQWNGQMFRGDLLFFLTLFAFVLALGIRGLLFRQDVPPPAFVLVALGILSALFGTVTQMVATTSPALLPGEVVTLGRLLLYQGYMLFPIMGVGAFLLPRFFGMSGRQRFPESMTLPPGWIRAAAFALGCGGIVMAGFIIEALDFPHWGNALRALGVLIYFIREIPVHQAKPGSSSLGLGLRVALFSIPLSYALMAVWPAYRLSLLHVLFITGFSLLIFIVSTRVILGHSGQSARFRSRIWTVLFVTTLFALAMFTRVSADWIPAASLHHYAYAALTWAAGVVAWAIFILPGVLRQDAES